MSLDTGVGEEDGEHVGARELRAEEGPMERSSRQCGSVSVAPVPSRRTHAARRLRARKRLASAVATNAVGVLGQAAAANLVGAVQAPAAA